MTKERLVLTGFMGMGKSTVGRRSAEMLKTQYNDTDEWMETTGVDVPELVKTDMPKFREIEAEALRTLLSTESGIISTGGGIVSTMVGRNALIGAKVPVVWLRAPFEVAESRVLCDNGRERPLFADIDKARALYEERMEWYQETASHVVDAARPVELIVNDVVNIALTN